MKVICLFTIIEQTQNDHRMEASQISSLSDEDLLKALKDLKPTRTYDSLIIGLLAGIAIYAAANNGFGLLVFLPLIYLPVATKNRKRLKAVKEELGRRDLRETQ